MLYGGLQFTSTISRRRPILTQKQPKFLDAPTMVNQNWKTVVQYSISIII